MTRVTKGLLMVVELTKSGVRLEGILHVAKGLGGWRECVVNWLNFGLWTRLTRRKRGNED